MLHQADVVHTGYIYLERRSKEDVGDSLSVEKPPRCTAAFVNHDVDEHW